MPLLLLLLCSLRAFCVLSVSVCACLLQTGSAVVPSTAPSDKNPEIMPKHGFLTPKAIGNRIKAKGLSKLRWYCEMCQKQCRDENGFKCHQTSEGHLRQMRIFAENPEEVMKQVGGRLGG